MVTAKKNSKESWHSWHMQHRPGFWLPIGLIILGLYFIARDYGWVPDGVPIWPWIIFVLGLTILIKRLILWRQLR